VSELNNRQELFVSFYLQNPNATQAAIKAGYSEKTAASQGERLLRNVEIAKRVQQRVESAAMSADEVLTELADIAKSGWREHLEILYRDGVIVDAKLRLTDKIKALELVGKHHKLFTDRVESSTDPDLERIRSVITTWAKENDMTVEATTRLVLDRYGSTLPKNVTQQLSSEMVN
jgi:phage terminase small subunit